MKPCPFCGSTDIGADLRDQVTIMRCDVCRATGPYGGFFNGHLTGSTYTVAVERWNQRGPQEPEIKPAERRELSGAIDELMTKLQELRESL